MGAQRGRWMVGATLSKVGFLSVVGAKLRTKVVAGRGPPKFHVTVARAERLAAEHEGNGAVDEIAAAREHWIGLTSCEKRGRSADERCIKLCYRLRRIRRCLHRRRRGAAGPTSASGPPP